MLRFRLGGMTVTVDFLFVALVTIFLLTDRTGISVIALLACFIHELGHLILFFLVGYTPRALSFELMGIRLTKPAQELTPGREMLVQLAGSATNFTVFFLLIGTLGSVTYASLFAVTHLLLGIFNLLPLKSLDGGKLLELCCLKCFGEHVAEIVTSTADLLTTAALLALSIYMVITDSKSMTLMVFSGGVFISLAAKLRRRALPRWTSSR